MKNELLHIGPLTVYGYGFMIAMGVLAAWFVTEQRARRLHLAYEHIFIWLSGVPLVVLLLRRYCSGSPTGKNFFRIRRRSSDQKDLWCMAGLLAASLWDGCTVR